MQDVGDPRFTKPVLYLKEGTPAANLIAVAMEYSPSKSITRSKTELKRGKKSPVQLQSKSLFLDTPLSVLSYLLHGEAFLVGSNTQEAAQILQWVGYARNELHAILCACVHFPERSEEKVGAAAVLEGLNKVLMNRTYLVGERLSVADVAVAVEMQLLCSILDKCNRDTHPNLLRWLNTCLQQPQFVKVLGKQELY